MCALSPGLLALSLYGLKCGELDADAGSKHAKCETVFTRRSAYDRQKIFKTQAIHLLDGFSDQRRGRLGGILSCCDFSGEVKRTPQFLHDLRKIAACQDCRRAAAPMQSLNGWFFGHRAFDQHDFLNKGRQIAGDRIVGLRRARIAAEKPAKLSATGHMQIGRRLFTGVNGCKPRPAGVFIDACVEMRRVG